LPIDRRRCVPDDCAVHPRRRIALPRALAVALALALLLASTGGAFARQPSRSRSLTAPAAAAAGASKLQVTQVEYRLLLSRTVVKAGAVDLEAIDRGMNAHDLRIRMGAGGPELAVPQLTPGKRWEGIVNLRPGTYRLWCSLPEHARLGMRATLQVVR
jgi:hypothetical protein